MASFLMILNNIRYIKIFGFQVCGEAAARILCTILDRLGPKSG
jgi:hypothetical protein